MTTTMTLGQAVTRFDSEVLEHLDTEASLPVVTRIAAQGDVMVSACEGPDATTMLPAAGFPVVRGENGGHTHALYGDGPVFYDPHTATSGTDLRLGTLTVPDGSTGVLLHPEHGGMQIAPGTYRIGRQREFAGEWRMVAD